jgi:hypothetical protein
MKKFYPIHRSVVCISTGNQLKICLAMFHDTPKVSYDATGSGGSPFIYSAGSFGAHL